MRLDEIEDIARRTVNEEGGDESLNEIDLARAVLAMLPVVRAAMRVRDGRYAIRTKLDRKDRYLFDEFNQAVDELQIAMESKP